MYDHLNFIHFCEVQTLCSHGFPLECLHLLDASMDYAIN